ncbi:MAG: CooT family nickel-binding protein [Desulfobacteraceae bacterium]|nr:CooT family nickel-binding protein [Desulfobacteraceae bacterium]
MCEVSAYLIQGGKEKLILESVDTLDSEDGEITLGNIFGEQKRVKAWIKSLSLVDRKIILEHEG